MTIEEIAAQAMNGILANPNCKAETPDVIANMALECAKALKEQIKNNLLGVEDAIIVG